MRTEEPVEGDDVEFSYSVKWSEVKVPFEDRLSLHLRSFSSNLYEHEEAHWLSILNSCMLVLLLVAFLAVVLIRILRNDLAKYLAVNEEACCIGLD